MGTDIHGKKCAGKEEERYEMDCVVITGPLAMPVKATCLWSANTQ